MCFVGAGGEGDARDFTALGDAVNTAARLADLAAAGEILITAEQLPRAAWTRRGSNDGRSSCGE